MIGWTRFDSAQASHKDTLRTSWQELISYIGAAGPYPDKAHCPWIKLAIFGDQRTANNSLRHNANLIEITGVEGDYDAGKVTPEQAIALLERAHIRAAVYTSPSHSPEHPRWRVLAPLSMPYAPTHRNRLLARVNGALGGILAGESFTLSQSYYYGRVNGHYAVTVTFGDPDEGWCVDELDELDEIAVGRSTSPDGPAAVPEGGKRLDPRLDAHALVRELGRKLRSGDGRRQMLKSYIASLSASGIGPAEIGLMVSKFVTDFFDPVDPVDERNVAQMISWAYARDREKARPSGPGDNEPDNWLDLGELPDFDVYVPPVRRWIIYGRMQRGFVGFTVSPPGVGKTAFQIATAVDVTLRQPFLNEEILDSVPCWIYTNEEDKDEMYRRLLGYCIANDISPKLLTGRLRISSGYGGKRLIVARRLADGVVVQTPEADALIQAIKDSQTGALLVDPFVSTHAVNENANAEIEEVMAAWRRVAAETGVAIDIAAHIPKSGNDSEAHAGSLDAIRGAGAAGGAARSAFTLARMNEESARLYGVAEEERLHLIRLDRAKGNYTAPASGATWLRMRPVCLNNSALRPDYVGVFDGVVALRPVEGMRDSRNEERDSRIRMAVISALPRVGQEVRLADVLDELAARGNASRTVIREFVPRLFPGADMSASHNAVVIWEKRRAANGGREELWLIRNRE